MPHILSNHRSAQYRWEWKCRLRISNIKHYPLANTPHTDPVQHISKCDYVHATYASFSTVLTWKPTESKWDIIYSHSTIKHLHWIHRSMKTFNPNRSHDDELNTLILCNKKENQCLFMMRWYATITNLKNEHWGE